MGPGIGGLICAQLRAQRGEVLDAPGIELGDQLGGRDFRGELTGP